MDIRMPNLDGIEATRRITAAAGSPRVLILTTFDLDQYVYEALRAGAMFLGDATIKTHVARIFSKLRLHDRAQAVVLACETGLVQPGGRETPHS